MVYPKVSILWINYNSKKIVDIVLESLYSVFELDYPNYEIIIVDNGSTDGSFNMIKQVIESRRYNNASVNVKLIRLRRNRGFNTANNIAFQARDKNTKYVVLLNNDAVLLPDSLLNLVEIIEAEKENGIAATQGVITTWDGTKVDNMGFVVDELLFVHALYRGYNPYDIKKPHYCTFVSGAYSIYSVEAILKVNKREILFDGHMFAYFDDKVLGLKLWCNGFKIKSFPIVAARHYGSATFGYMSPKKIYLTTRNFLALCRITKTMRYKPFVLVGYPLRRLAEMFLMAQDLKELKEGLYSIIRAIFYANKCQSLIDYSIHLNKVLILRLNFINAIKIISKKA